MGDQKVPFSKETQLPPLRRPYTSLDSSLTASSDSHDPSLNLSDSVSNINLQDSIVSNSKLRVSAEEWFPPNYNANAANTPAPKSSVQQRLKKYKQETETEDQDSLDGDQDTECLRELHLILFTLMEDPGQYDSLIHSFMIVLRPYYDSIEVLSSTTDLIFNEALKEANFRYNAARLCSFIANQIPLFRAGLHIKCKKVMEENGNDPNTALFLAEIYEQLNHEELYGGFVVRALQALVLDDKNIKAACQILKLTGVSLDNYNSDAINAVFNSLKTLKEKPEVSSSLRNMIDSVITLRQSNWGQQSSDNTESTVPNFPHDSLYYDDDGQALTEAERQFLVENGAFQDYESVYFSDSDPDGLWDPDPEMDPEIQAAFKEFIQISK